MSDRRLISPGRALSETLGTQSERLRVTAARAGWQTPILSRIFDWGVFNFPNPPADALDPSWPDNALGTDADLTLPLPRGRWAVLFAASVELTVNNYYSGLFVMRSGATGTASTTQQYEFVDDPSGAIAIFSESTLRSVALADVQVDSGGEAVLEVGAGFKTPAVGASIAYRLLRTSIIAYPA